MSWVIAVLGIIGLILIHEFGHFLVAKATGMRVERFSIFFPPKIIGIKRGETEYMIGAIPAGGYVKITGMNPEEIAGLDPEVARRAYYNQAPWKRILVILAGPSMNLLVAFLAFFIVLVAGNTDGTYTLSRLNPSIPTVTGNTTVGGFQKGSPAAGVFRLGDQIVSVGGQKATYNLVRAATERDTCPGTPVANCQGHSPINLEVLRHGRVIPLSITPRYDTSSKRMLFGFLSGATPKHYTLLSAVPTTIHEMSDTTSSLISGLAHALTSSKARKGVSSIVEVTVVTKKAVAGGWGYAFIIFGFVSLTLAIINLFPFLPLDGGHIAWAAAEHVLRRRVSVITMYRYSLIGIFALVFLVLNGFLNDISRLT